MATRTRASLKAGKPNAENIICPVCEEVIEDQSETKEGQDSIECDGQCASWLHRRCAGLSKHRFAEISSVKAPFLCPPCRLATQECEIVQLKSALSAIEKKLDAVITSLANVKHPHKVSQPPNFPQTYSQALSGASPPSEARTLPLSMPDRKSNLVVFGIPEHPPGTQRHTRTSADLAKLGEILGNLNNTISEQSIRDCFRLGRFRESHTRPILVKLVRTCDVSLILSSRRQLQHVVPRISIRPDMSKEERQLENILLKERRALIDSGVPRESIKLRGKTLFKDNKKYGTVDGQGQGSHFRLCDVKDGEDGRSSSTQSSAPLTGNVPQVQPGNISTIQSDQSQT